MIDRFLNWGDHGKPKSGKIKGRCQPPLLMSNNFRTTAVLKKKTSICLIYVSHLYLRWKKEEA